MAGSWSTTWLSFKVRFASAALLEQYLIRTVEMFSSLHMDFDRIASCAISAISATAPLNRAAAPASYPVAALRHALPVLAARRWTAGCLIASHRALENTLAVVACSLKPAGCFFTHGSRREATGGRRATGRLGSRRQLYTTASSCWKFRRV